MKKILFLISITVFSLQISKAQNELDALRYSLVYPGGTARNMAMGGAFTAFGADFSSLSMNPAGIGTYRTAEITITPSMNYSLAKSTYLGETKEDLVSNFYLSNGGLVFVAKTNKASGLKSLNFGVGYNREFSYGKNLIMEGTNTNSSLLDHFANMANGTPYTDLYPYEEGIAWDVYMIDTLDGQPLNYGTVFSLWGSEPNSTYGQLQRRTVKTSGGKGEYVFTAGGNFGHFLYFGGTFGIHKLNFKQEVDHFESDQNSNITEFDYFKFSERLTTRGTGYSFKMGFLFKPVQMLRIGAAAHFPYSYKIKEDYYTMIESGFDTPDSEGNYVYNSAAYPDQEYEYKLTVPFRAVGSVGLQLFKLALIGVDVEYIDYSTMRLGSGSDNYDFYSENESIREAYRDVLNFRAGVEFRLGFMSLRAGGTYYMSPYAENEANVDADYYALTTGFGIRDKSFFFDLAYQYSDYQEQYFMYPHQNIQGSTNQFTRHRIMATLGFKF